MPAEHKYLKAELDKPEYAGLTHQQAADLLNAEVKVRYANKVPIGWLQQKAVALDKLEAIQAAAGTNAAAAKTYWLWSSTRNDFPSINMQDPKFEQNLDDLIEAAILSAEDKEEILDLSAAITTRAKQAPGWGIEASALDVQAARSIA